MNFRGLFLLTVFFVFMGVSSVFAFPQLIPDSQNVQSQNCLFYEHQIKCNNLQDADFTYLFKIKVGPKFDVNNLSLRFLSGNSVSGSCSQSSGDLTVYSCSYSHVMMKGLTTFLLQYNRRTFSTIKVGVDNTPPHFISYPPLKLLKSSKNDFNFSFYASDDFTYVKEASVVFKVNGNSLPFDISSSSLHRSGNMYWFLIPKSSLGSVSKKVDYSLKISDLLGNKASTSGKIYLDDLSPKANDVSLLFSNIPVKKITFPSPKGNNKISLSLVMFVDESLSSLKYSFVIGNQKGTGTIANCMAENGEYECKSNVQINAPKTTQTISFNVDMTDKFGNTFHSVYSFPITVSAMNYKLLNSTALYMPNFVDNKNYMLISKNGENVNLKYSNNEVLSGIYLKNGQSVEYSKPLNSPVFKVRLVKGSYSVKLKDLFGQLTSVPGFNVALLKDSVKVNSVYVPILPSLNSFFIKSVYNGLKSNASSSNARTVDLTAGSIVDMKLNIRGMLLDTGSVWVDSTSFNIGTSKWPLSCQKNSPGNYTCTVSFHVDKNQYSTGKFKISFKDVLGNTYSNNLSNFVLKKNSNVPPTYNIILNSIQGFPDVYNTKANFALGNSQQQIFMLFNISRNDDSFNIYSQRINNCHLNSTTPNDDTLSYISLGTPSFLYTPFNISSGSLKNGISLPISVATGQTINPFLLTCNVSLYVSDANTVYNKPITFAMTTKFNVSFSEDDMNNLYYMINKTWYDVKNPNGWISALVQAYDYAKIFSSVDTILMGFDALSNDLCWVGAALKVTFPVVGSGFYSSMHTVAQWTNNAWQMYHPWAFWATPFIEDKGIPQWLKDVRRNEVQNQIVPPMLMSWAGYLKSLFYSSSISSFIGDANGIFNNPILSTALGSVSLSPFLSLYNEPSDNIYTAWSFLSIKGVAENAIKMQNAKCQYLGCLLTAYKTQGPITDCKNELALAQYRYDPTMSQAGVGGWISYALIGGTSNILLYLYSNPNEYTSTAINILIDLISKLFGQGQRFKVMLNYIGYLFQEPDVFKMQGIQSALGWWKDFAEHNLGDWGDLLSGNLIGAATNGLNKMFFGGNIAKNVFSSSKSASKVCPLGALNATKLSKYSWNLASTLLFAPMFAGTVSQVVKNNGKLNWTKVFNNYFAYLSNMGDKASNGAITQMMDLFNSCTSDMNNCINQLAVCPYTEKYATFSDFAKVYFAGGP